MTGEAVRQRKSNMSGTRTWHWQGSSTHGKQLACTVKNCRWQSLWSKTAWSWWNSIWTFRVRQLPCSWPPRKFLLNGFSETCLPAFWCHPYKYAFDMRMHLGHQSLSCKFHISSVFSYTVERYPNLIITNKCGWLLALLYHLYIHLYLKCSFAETLFPSIVTVHNQNVYILETRTSQMLSLIAVALTKTPCKDKSLVKMKANIQGKWGNDHWHMNTAITNAYRQ